jgi:hypothetical protein
VTEAGLAAPPTITATGSRLSGGAVLGAVIAGIAWAVSGVTAVIYPEWDVGISGPFYVIEGAHAVAETAMVPALLLLWKGQRTCLHRPGNFGFVLTVAATALLAAITYVTVVLPLVGITGESLVGTVLFLFCILGTVVGFIVCGIATIRARVWPPASGPLLIAHPLLLLAVLAFHELWESYATSSPLVCCGSPSPGSSQHARPPIKLDNPPEPS